ncbi:MAG: hypothetical protein U1E26_05050 [Coriobacteriia bacterium]|nr:hypothetical protein [Coriobacteriia bacterium]
MNPHRVIMAAAVACVLMAPGCAPPPEDPVTTGVPAGRQAESVSRPGLTRTGDQNEATAVGTLVFRRDQGGFFGLADMTPSQEPSTDARILVVLVQEDGNRSAPDLAPLVGAYCAFSGTLRTETTLTPIPELVFDSYRVLVPVPGP